MIKINLLPDAKPTKKKKGVSALGGGERLNVLLMVGAIVLGLMVILVQWWVYRSQIKDLDEKIRKDQLELARLESILKEVKDFEDKKAKLQKKVDLINQLKQNQKGPVRLMDEVSNALPDLIWLEKMEYRGNTINLTGKALNPPAVANFLENLKKVSAFQEPRVQDISATSVGGAALYNFQLSFVFSTLDRTQQPEPAPAGAAPGTAAAPATGAPKAELSGAGPAAVAAGL